MTSETCMKDDFWHQKWQSSPRPSRRTRRAAKRSKASSLGGTVVHLPGRRHPIIIYFESKLEQRVLFLLLANSNVVDIWEQPPFITYVNDQGKRKQHFPDFLVTLKSGLTLAVAVKPSKLVRRNGFVRELQCIRRAMQENYADDILLITDQDFTKAEALNAERFHEFSRSRNAAVIARLQQIVRETTFPVSIQELSSQLGAGGAGFRAVFIAIYEGLLFADKTQLISLDTTVCAGGEQ